MQQLILNGKKARGPLKNISCSFFFLFFTAKSGDREANEPCMEYMISPLAFLNDDIELTIKNHSSFLFYRGQNVGLIRE